MGIEPINIRGVLPQNAIDQLCQETFHPIAAHRMGAITVEPSSLHGYPPFTTDEIQSAEGCAGVVVFFKGFNIGKDSLTFEKLDILPRFFGQGVIDHLKRAVLYIGGYTNPTGTELHWVGMPFDPKEWYPRG